MSLIGMTTSPEAFLAREAELCYACMAHVTDYDVWHVSEEPVKVEMVIRILNRNADLAQQAIGRLAAEPADRSKCPCGSALSTALITDPAHIPAETKQKLRLLLGKYVP
jgi:5'-methylthioadenosine phosphorylase